MTALFLAAFILGLVLAVRIMLFGIERGDGAAVQPGTHRQRPRFGMTGLAVALLVFGVAGYATMAAGRTTGGSVVALVGGLAVVAGALAAWGSAKWAAMPVEHDVDDPRYVLQGHVALVVKSIEPGQDGEIAFEVESGKRVVRARAFDGRAIPAGTEVVIESVADDVASVEPWHEVEQRL